MALKQNIIYIYFKGKHQVTSKSQYQYNRRQYLYFADLNLPQAFEVHFSNKDKGESKTQIGSDTNIYKKSPHKIRATYDTILLDAHLDKRFIKDQMGHSDITTSEKYYHRNRKSIEKKSEIINSIPEFALV